MHNYGIIGMSICAKGCKHVYRTLFIALALSLSAACSSDGGYGSGYGGYGGGAKYDSSSLAKHYKKNGGELGMGSPRDNDYYYVPVRPPVVDNDSYYVAPRYSGRGGRRNGSSGYPLDNDSDYSYPIYWD